MARRSPLLVRRGGSLRPPIPQWGQRESIPPSAAGSPPRRTSAATTARHASAARRSGPARATPAPLARSAWWASSQRATPKHQW